MRRPALLALALLAACRSGPAVMPLTDGPLAAGALGRSAWQSPHATILARGSGEAQEAADFAASVAGDFERDTGRPAAARVLIVAGSGGWIDHLLRRLELSLAGNAALHGEPAPTPGRLADLQAELDGEQAELGLPPELLLALRAEALRAADLGHAGLPAAATAAFDWGLVLPTEDEIEDVVELSIDAALEHEDVSLAVRLLAAPLLPFVRGAMEDAVVAAMRGVLFAMHAAAQPDWSPAERRDRSSAYVASLRDEDAPPQLVATPAPEAAAASEVPPDA